jgi:hypothetical protein
MAIRSENRGNFEKFEKYEELSRSGSLRCKMELGRIAEEKFMKWLDEAGLPYIYLDQTPKTLPAVFRKITKRPDFIVKVTNEQTISVDVKYRTIDPKYKNFGIDEENDILRLKSFEDIFGIPVWFAVCSCEGDFLTWYWIKLDKIILEVPLVVNGTTNKPFRCISIKKTLKVGHNLDLFIEEILKN